MPFSRKLREEIAVVLTSYAPNIPYDDAKLVKEHAASRHLRSLPPRISVWLSLVSHIRHHHTEYDALIVEGYDSESARHFVRDATNDVLTRWRSTRKIEVSD